MRVKVKFTEYLRLHRIVTGVSNLVIWEHLAGGRSFDDLLDKVPDEFYEWVKKTSNELKEQYNAILTDSQNSFRQMPPDAGRKEIALYFKTQKHPPILFAMLDGKPFDKIIWKMLKPRLAKPYKMEV